ncbi:hypothetical protein H0H81_003068 [Sphagnurus paluster]|uniref:F-box domain-containing protein n=1 Tax=Sphagnurus paluster TaxID=117069 RepID=A0A9P7GP85_9AGAR|nr:hypothetical protein H0H81_003068 [Sphagnurus paluster]
MSLATLPTELYEHILSHVPLQNIRQTILALTRALPLAGISQRHLFESICITVPRQAPRLHRRLRSRRDVDSPDPALWVQHLAIHTWQIDADVLINLVPMLPNLETLDLWIGPTNFAPEHLEQLFKRVKKATYYQFLKGSYFDSTLLAISEWPASPQGLPELSIVQDPFTPDPSDVTSQRFAQPIVFFRLDLNLSLLVHSPGSSASLQSLRIRIPARSVTQPLTVAYLNPQQNVPHTLLPPPAIQFLDLATCAVSEADIETLLLRQRHLRHLILDACPGLLRAGTPQALGEDLDWWSALGRRCALTGLKKARDREKELKAWYEELTRAVVASESGQAGEASVAPQEQKGKVRKGRRGLATATISLRGSSSPPRAAPSASAVSSAAAVAMIKTMRAGGRAQPPVPPKVHIVPPLPTLRTLCLFPTATVHTPAGVGAVDRILSEFASGWNDGVRVMWEKRPRIGASFSREPAKGVPRARFLRFREGREGAWGVQEPGFEGLEDVPEGELGVFFRHEVRALGQGDVPVLCFAGPDEDAERHAEGCGHSIARHIWVYG